MVYWTMKVFSDQLLDHHRIITDSAADQILSLLYQRPENFDKRIHDPVAQIKNLASQNISPYKEFLIDFYTKPAWVDFDRMLPGSKLFIRNSLVAAVSLAAAGLIESYTSQKGNKVLIATGRLHTDIAARIFETGEMVKATVSPGGLQPGGDGLEALLKVRFLHAAVRSYIKNSGHWQNQWGEPINQEDMAGTLIMFSMVTLRSIKELGVPVTREEEESYHHLWRYAGHLLGVSDTLLTDTPDEEIALYNLIKARQFHPDEDSRTLATALLQGVANSPPFFLPFDAVCELSRMLIGEELADGLQLPSSFLWRTIFTGIRMGFVPVQMALSKVSVLREASYQLGELYINSNLEHGLPSGKSSYQLKITKNNTSLKNAAGNI